MSPPRRPTPRAADLRRRAQEKVRGAAGDADALPCTEEDLKKLVWELQVHQVELEIQNEELQAAKAAVEESNARFAELYEFAPVGYFTLDRLGTIRGSNLRGASFLGVERSRLENRRLSSFVAEDDRRAVTDFLTHVFLGLSPRACEVRLHDGAGHPAWLELEATLSASGDECLLTAGDVTARKRAEAERQEMEEQLRQGQKMQAIGVLSGGIAHDFNNILTPIVSYAELALLHLADARAVREDLSEILVAAERAAALVQQILLIGRKDAGAAAVPVTLGPFVKEAMKLLRASLPTMIDIRTRVDPACGAVLGEVSQLHQVLLNLCINAAYAMRAGGGVLTVCVDGACDARGGRKVRLSVRDTGEGIPKDVLARVFEPYFTTKPVGKGSGLGLSVVHGIVSKMGGQVRIESTPGEGTAVEVVLPQVEAHASAVAGALGEAPRGRGQHVLVVDDEVAVRTVLRKLLTALGYRVTDCCAAAEAVAAFRADPGSFDAVLTDYAMPGVTGLDLAAELLGVRPDVPIILGTGFAEDLDGGVAAAQGLSGFLTKPYTLYPLGAALRRALGDADGVARRDGAVDLSPAGLWGSADRATLGPKGEGR